MTTAVVLGGAPSLHDDLAAIGSTDLAIGTNDALYSFRDLDCIATLHPENVRGGGPDKEWITKRRAKGWPDVPVYTLDRTWANESGFRLWRTDDPTMGSMWARGSSGLYAVGVAIHALNADEVYLAGVCMDASPNLYRDEGAWAQFKRYQAGWIRAKEGGWLDNVRSPSGWTAELLGTTG